MKTVSHQIRLRPVTDGNKTFVEWYTTFKAAPEKEAGLAAFFANGIYKAGFQALQSRAY